MKKVCLVSIILSLLVVFVSCAPKAAEPVTRQITAAPPQPTAVVPTKAAWEQKWETTLAGAKSEGKVNIYSLWGPLVRDAIAPPFTGKYGIELEWVTLGRGNEMVAKIKNEKTAGLNIVDLMGGGATTLITGAKPVGLLAPIESSLILPEVLDTKVWRGNQLPFLDKDKTAMGLAFRLTNNIVVNSDIIKPGEITSLKDLLKPQYKGKVTINDPSAPGSGNAIMASLAFFEWNEQEAVKYFKDLLANGT
ncbi:MAG: ABC transporter substrate-binding protein, partial [Dehalococcoidia bacterium]|nr:ABC transporter substrate-binding protein [Dehalococcoidia bacterium]